MEYVEYILQVAFFAISKTWPILTSAAAGAYVESKYGSTIAADIAAIKAKLTSAETAATTVVADVKKV